MSFGGSHEGGGNATPRWMVVETESGLQASSHSSLSLEKGVRASIPLNMWLLDASANAFEQLVF